MFLKLRWIEVRPSIVKLLDGVDPTCSEAAISLDRSSVEETLCNEMLDTTLRTVELWRKERTND